MMSSLLSREHTQWVQGVSALTIMLFHYVMEIDGYPRFFNIFGSVCVAAFLFISGFGLNESYKKKGLKGYWRNRFLRVMLPFWLVLTVKALVVGVPDDVVAWAAGYCFINSELWFVDFIMRCYLVYWIARRFLPEKHVTGFLLLASLLCILDQQFVSEQAMSFFLGYMASRHYARLCTCDRRRLAWVAVACVLYGTAFVLLKEIPAIRVWKGTLPYNVILLNIKMPLAVSILAAPVLCPRIMRLLPCCAVGRMSYELYIVHYNFMPCITGLLSIVGWSALSMLLALFLYRLDVLLKHRLAAIAVFLLLV